MAFYAGSFGSGFINAFLAAQRLQMQRHHFQIIDDYYQSLMHNQMGLSSGAQQAGDAAVAAARARMGMGDTGGAANAGAPSGSDFDRFKQSLVGQESGGSYSIEGPDTRSGRAQGKYQIMPANVAAWTKQYLGQEMTPEQFRASPEAQDKVFEGKINDLYNQYGNWRDVASVWHSGVPYNQAVEEGRHDVNMTTRQYTENVVDHAGLGGIADPADRQTAANLPQGQRMQEGAGNAVNYGPNDVYRNIPVTGDRGEKQVPMFMKWNPDPIGLSNQKLAEVHPDLQAVVKRAQQDNPGMKFVVALGKSTPDQEKDAKDWGWSQSQAGNHSKGMAVDLWPIKDGKVDFDPKAQQQINQAMQKASSELGVKVKWGGPTSEGGANPHFADRPNFELQDPRKLSAQEQQKMNAAYKQTQAAHQHTDAGIPSDDKVAATKPPSGPILQPANQRQGEGITSPLPQPPPSGPILQPASRLANQPAIPTTPSPVVSQVPNQSVTPPPATPPATQAPAIPLLGQSNLTNPLAHLWGDNPPLAQRQSAPGACQ